MEKNVDIKTRKVKVIVKNLEIEFEESYKVDVSTGEEIFDRQLEIENDTKLYDIYKKKKGLLSITEIKEIREKYGMNQKEYAAVLGVGEVTINRFENGAIQTEATDAIIRLSAEPENMRNLLLKRQNDIPKDVYNKYMDKVMEILEIKAHKIAKFELKNMKSKEFETINILDVADKIVEKYNEKYKEIKKEYNVETNEEYITPLKLQKLLYYVQGLALHIYNKPAFENKIIAWSYGPVSEEIYYKYKTKRKSPIDTLAKCKEISNGLNDIIDIVVNDYGKYSAGSLIDLTHSEQPWKSTDINEEITQSSIKEYFDKVYAE